MTWIDLLHVENIGFRSDPLPDSVQTVAPANPLYHEMESKAANAQDLTLVCFTLQILDSHPTQKDKATAPIYLLK